MTNLRIYIKLVIYKILQPFFLVDISKLKEVYKNTSEKSNSFPPSVLKPLTPLNSVLQALFQLWTKL